MQEAVEFLGSNISFLSGNVPARLLRVMGVIAFLVGKVDLDIIQILGCWRSDKMFRCLHLSEEPIVKDFSAKMLTVD